MQYRKIGDSDLRVSEISLGCWTLGGLNWVNGVPNGWENVDETEAIAAINFAIDQGVNHFDNADVYGNGRAERLLAKALGTRNKEVIIATKVGYFAGTAAHAYEPQHIRHQLEQSLVNLKREYVDIYYFHNANFGNNDMYLDDAVAMMYRLKDEGKLRVLGLSARSDAEFARFIPKIKPTVLQGQASILNDHFVREENPVWNLMKERNMSFVAFSPLEQGLLLNKYRYDRRPDFKEGDHRKRSPRFDPKNLIRLKPKMEKLVARFGNDTKELARVALQYLLFQEVVAAVIPGFRNQAQVINNLAGADQPLTQVEIAFIRATFYD
ncbi:MAG: aldo/keto reductase [Candidatus Marinimicrobia bacterium]|nr:aldo/keto reductase [Candidatus Neomarinimicrobiota bacterium]